jgi:hypothetical protein
MRVSLFQHVSPSSSVKSMRGGFGDISGRSISAARGENRGPIEHRAGHYGLYAYVYSWLTGVKLAIPHQRVPTLELLSVAFALREPRFQTTTYSVVAQ